MADAERGPAGHRSPWLALSCEAWRAERLLAVTGLDAAPYTGGHGPALAPPTYLVAQGVDSGSLGVPDAPVRLNGGNWCRWEQPVHVGDRLERQTTVADVTEKSGRSGRLVLYTLATEYRRADDHQVVARARSTAIRRYPHDGPAGAGADAGADAVEAHTGEAHTDRAPAPSDRPTAAPGPAPGPVPGDDGSTGDGPLAGTEELLVVTPTSRDLVRYAAATDDWYEAHYDLAFARRRGLPGVIVHGLLKLGWLARAATVHAGPGSVVWEVAGSYRGVDLVDRPFTVRGAPAPADDGPVPAGATRLRLYGVSADGAVTTTGTAVVGHGPPGSGR